MKRWIATLVVALTAPFAFAAGTLTPTTASHAPITIRDHAVDVTIDNGFARTEVVQTFFNPNTTDLEAIYGFPVPSGASLSEITIWNGDRVLNGEVVEAKEASRIYTEERDAGKERRPEQIPRDVREDVLAPGTARPR